MCLTLTSCSATISHPPSSFRRVSSLVAIVSKGLDLCIAKGQEPCTFDRIVLPRSGRWGQISEVLPERIVFEIYEIQKYSGRGGYCLVATDFRKDGGDVSSLGQWLDGQGRSGTIPAGAVLPPEECGVR